MGDLTIGSLFSGIGGLELGLEQAGMRTAWQVEMDDYATSVLERHWPDAIRFRDVREVGAHNLPRVDLICGGFPCQDISLAGKGAGLAGERSGLWFEFARIVRELQPRYVVVENVAALLGRGLGRVLGDLAACGYDAEWDCIPAAAVGAHHRRDRLFVVAYSQRDTLRLKPEPELRRSGAVVSGFDGSLRNVAESADSGAGDSHSHGERLAQREECDTEKESGPQALQPRRDARGLRDPLADADLARLEERTIFGGDAREELAATFRSSRTGGGVWAAESGVGRVADGVPSRVDRLRCLGNAVVPQVAAFIGRRIVALESLHAS